MLVIRAGIHKFLVRIIANSADPDQTASSEAVRSGMHGLFSPFGKQTVLCSNF